MIAYRTRFVSAADLAPPPPRPPDVDAPPAGSPPERYIRVPISLLEAAVRVLEAFGDAAGDVGMMGLDDAEMPPRPAVGVGRYREARTLRHTLLAFLVADAEPNRGRRGAA